MKLAGKRRKPQGRTGPLIFGPNAVTWQVVNFPSQKDEREKLVARLFVEASEKSIRGESEPTLKPFYNLKQNSENDLDFSVQTAAGQKLMELAEFAPLRSFGPTFSSAPTQLSTGEKVNSALELICAKSAHQGGKNRFLLLYATEHGFELDEVTIELLRRALGNEPPRFDKVYFTQLFNLDLATATEVFPSVPHEWFGDLTDEALTSLPVVNTHPAEQIVGCAWITKTSFKGCETDMRITLSYHGFYRLSVIR